MKVILENLACRTIWDGEDALCRSENLRVEKNNFLHREVLHDDQRVRRLEVAGKDKPTMKLHFHQFLPNCTSKTQIMCSLFR